MKGDRQKRGGIQGQIFRSGESHGERGWGRGYRHDGISFVLSLRITLGGARYTDGRLRSHSGGQWVSVHTVVIAFPFQTHHYGNSRLRVQMSMSSYSWKAGRPGLTFLHGSGWLELSRASCTPWFKETLKHTHTHTPFAHNNRFIYPDVTDWGYPVVQIKQT